MKATLQNEIDNLKIVEKKQKDGSVNYLVTTLDGRISSGLHANFSKAQKALLKVASNVTYKKNLLKYKQTK
jgi:phage tail tube protein FII